MMYVYTNKKYKKSTSVKVSKFIKIFFTVKELHPLTITDRFYTMVSSHIVLLLSLHTFC